MGQGWKPITHISGLNTTVLGPYTRFLHCQQMSSTHSNGGASTAEMGRSLRLPPQPFPEVTEATLTLDHSGGARLYMGRTTLGPLLMRVQEGGIT